MKYLCACHVAFAKLTRNYARLIGIAAFSISDITLRTIVIVHPVISARNFDHMFKRRLTAALFFWWLNSVLQ